MTSIQGDIQGDTPQPGSKAIPPFVLHPLFERVINPADLEFNCCAYLEEAIWCLLLDNVAITPDSLRIWVYEDDSLRSPYLHQLEDGNYFRQDMLDLIVRTSHDEALKTAYSQFKDGGP